LTRVSNSTPLAWDLKRYANAYSAVSVSLHNFAFGLLASERLCIPEIGFSISWGKLIARQEIPTLKLTESVWNCLCQKALLPNPPFGASVKNFIYTGNRRREHR
jgi:hypothetical protein